MVEVTYVDPTIRVQQRFKMALTNGFNEFAYICFLHLHEGHCAINKALACHAGGRGLNPDTTKVYSAPIFLRFSLVHPDVYLLISELLYFGNLVEKEHKLAIDLLLSRKSGFGDYFVAKIVMAPDAFNVGLLFRRMAHQETDLSKNAATLE